MFQVTAIFLDCNYLGYSGRYERDIAILRIDKPFRLSAYLMPACLCGPECNDQMVLEAGNYGVVAGFGRTKSGESSRVLQSLRIPYVGYTECQNSSKIRGNRAFLTTDKFCAGYANGEHFRWLISIRYGRTLRNSEFFQRLFNHVPSRKSRLLQRLIDPSSVHILQAHIGTPWVNLTQGVPTRVQFFN